MYYLLYCADDCAINATKYQLSTNWYAGSPAVCLLIMSYY